MNANENHALWKVASKKHVKNDTFKGTFFTTVLIQDWKLPTQVGAKIA